MLALWEYQWDEDEWSGTTSTTDPFFGLLLALQWEAEEVTTPAAASAGHGKKSNNYLGQPPDYWLAREQYLRNLVQETVSDALPKRIERLPQEPGTSPAPAPFIPPPDLNGPAILQMQALIAALNRAYTATNQQEMLDAAARARALAIDIQKLRQQYNDRAVEILLLDVF